MGERIRARGRTRADARAHVEADAVFFRLVRGLQILLTVHGAGALPGYGPLGQILALLISLLFCLLFCCLVCWSVCPSLIGHPTRVRFPVLLTGPLPTTFPPFHPLHTSFSLFIELWSRCGRRHPRSSTSSEVGLFFFIVRISARFGKLEQPPLIPDAFLEPL